MKSAYKYFDFYKVLSMTLVVLLMILLLINCQPKSAQDGNTGNNDIMYSLKAENNTDLNQSNFLVDVNKATLAKDNADINLHELVVFSGDKEIPSQASDDKLYFMIDQLNPNESKQYEIKAGKPGIAYPKRSQAELSVKTGGHFENRKYIGGDFENIQYLRVPDEHTDHSFYIRYEGPGWESDLVGYRFYLDWRNATDVFGKKTDRVVLQEVGLDGFDSYHEMQDWGQDVLKVGSSLGIGSLGIYYDDHAVRVDKTDSVTCEISDNGVIYSAIRTNYYGWKVGDNTFDVESVLSIHAGTRLTHHEVNISGQPENMCTGVGKDSNAKLYTDQGSMNSFGYLATYGKQSLNNDLLGLAVFFSGDDYKGFTEDEYSHIVKLGVNSGMFDYYFLAAWEGEENGIKDEAQFLSYIKDVARQLANPVEVKLSE